MEEPYVLADKGDEAMSRPPVGLTSPPHHNTSQSNSNVGNVNGVSTSTRVFIQRDYRQGVAIRFMPDFPAELNGRIDQNTYEHTLNTINTLFEEAEMFDCSTFFESCVGFLTANLVHMCKDTRYEKCLKRVSKFIAEQNQRVYLPRGLQITDPIERGLRCIEIILLNDPQRS